MEDLVSLKAEAVEALIRQADVSVLAEVEDFAREVRDRYGKLDALFINAGITSRDMSVEESDGAEWDRVISVNLLGAYHTAKCLIPLVKKSDNGKIIFLGSGLGHRGKAGTSAYSCSKAGVRMLMNVLSEELLESGVAVNELVPGPVNTNIDTGKKEKHSSVGYINEWYKEPSDLLPLVDFLLAQPKGGPTGQTFSLARRVID
jgi:3-oxoacyl-[acyl-carrier protein] reductase